MTPGLVLRAAERRALPWKNGTGVTTEVLAYPAGSGLDDFGWRISIAEVAQDGPFSMFGNVDRILTILEGTLDLRVGNADNERLDPGSDPFRFPGDVPAFGSPIGERVRDLNVMTRRGTCRASVERLTMPARGPLELVPSDWALLLAMQCTTIAAEDHVIDLAPLDAVLLRATSFLEIATDIPCSLVVVRLFQLDPGLPLR